MSNKKLQMTSGFLTINFKMWNYDLEIDLKFGIRISELAVRVFFENIV